MSRSAFEWICEIEPPTKPDMMHVRHQIGVLSKVASAYLIPDNHVGRATVSSIAVAHEVDRMGGRAIACLNARDRNALGFRRDLLTGAAYGVDEFLFVYGDAPVSGARTGQLTVRSMIDNLHEFSQEHQGHAGRFRAGVTTRLQPLPSWKRAADFLFVQVSFDLEQLLAWRDTVAFDGEVYAGVMVLPSAAMARKLVADIPQITIPQRWIDAVETDRHAGAELACQLAGSIADSGAFDGVHLIPGVRYRETAALLENQRLT
ncbi:MAG: methylenetetrahydrofolate reductase [Actinomycetota bacterium]|nr:methylenetetrahydrofolate reductase [Actinomycetota bacterium]